MKKTLYITLLVLIFASTAPTWAKDEKKPARSTQTQAVQAKVEKNIADKSANQRQQIISEAVEAVADTEKALRALDSKKPEEALTLLEKATGKLNIILARDPDLTLAPIDISEVAYDLYADLDAVKAQIKTARKALNDGEVQKARLLIKNLASEIVISTTSIPLATYPDAIKDIVPLLDQGKTEEAALALHDLLNTLVVTEYVVPLPLLRAELLLAEAETLAENEKRTEEENKSLKDMLEEARLQLEMAELLGYAKKDVIKPLYKQIKEIEEKTAGGKSGKGWFDNIKQQIKSLLKK